MILIFGTVCLDRVRSVPKLPEPGGYVEITKESIVLGGEAANTANALQSWGVAFELWGNSVGVGPESELLTRLLAAKQLQLHGTRNDALPATPVCDIYVTPDGDRTMYGIGFSTMSEGIDEDSIPFRPGHWFTAEPNMHEMAVELAKNANAAGMKTYLMDFMDPVEVPPNSVWQGSTDTAGKRGSPATNLEWVENWVASTGAFTILSDGANGLYAGGPANPARAYPAFPTEKVVDTTGAGDVFRAGMLFGLEKGWSMATCLQFAAAAGALKCRSLGATTEVPKIDEVKKLISDHPEISGQYL